MGECQVHGPHEGWYFWDGGDPDTEELAGGIGTFCKECVKPTEPSALVKQYREERIRQQISIYHAAKELKMTPAEFSAFERGKVEPTTEYLLGMYYMLS